LLSAISKSFDNVVTPTMFADPDNVVAPVTPSVFARDAAFNTVKVPSV